MPKNIDSKYLKITRRTTTPETMTHAEVATLFRETTGLNRLCILRSRLPGHVAIPTEQSQLI